MRMRTTSRYAHLPSLRYVLAHAGWADLRVADSQPESVLVDVESGPASLAVSPDFRGPGDYRLLLTAVQFLDAGRDYVRGYVSIGPEPRDNTRRDNNTDPALLVRHRYSCVATGPVLRLGFL